MLVYKLVAGLTQWGKYFTKYFDSECVVVLLVLESRGSGGAQELRLVVLL